ncbi:hypothetical protein QTP70_032040 [Hemibagrus guttatus]|uniref:Reverse transcriptase/retrotransposon-derived protein RNase H-like domain-containing protein n=1 Tax=Hemibagrus guttatus TaxID=175788 RepID=A0AAE0QRI5_9TELE|nr:hypothetical protein QTP70_032040 [Hemibagrus guttatus]
MRGTSGIQCSSDKLEDFWPQYLVMPFGLTNAPAAKFGYSSIANPLHQLTPSKKKFVWNPEVQAAISRLKDCFSSAPILTLPDSCKQFIVEVDTSDLGVGAVLSQ